MGQLLTYRHSLQFLLFTCIHKHDGNEGKQSVINFRNFKPSLYGGTSYGVTSETDVLE